MPSIGPSSDATGAGADSRSGKLAPTRVLIVDDHPFVCDGISGLLESQSDFVVVGQAATVAQAREMLPALKPNLVLVDLRLPDGDGSQVLKDIRAMRWGTYAVVLSAFCTDDDLLAAARAGAAAFLLKTARGAEVLSVLRRVMNGENVLMQEFSPVLRDRLLQKDLGPRELQVLSMIGKGMSNKEISQFTGTTANTVKMHLRRIFQKLGVHTRAEAATIAVRRGLVPLISISLGGAILRPLSSLLPAWVI